MNVDPSVELEALRANCAALEERNARLKKLLDKTMTELALLKRQLFGQKSERIDPRQTQLAFSLVMDAIERLAGGDETAAAEAEAALEKLRQLKTAKKKSTPHGRREVAKMELPVERVVIEPPELQFPGAELLVKIGEDVSEHIDRRPASMVRVQVVRPKYLRPEDPQATTSNVTTILQADLPARPVPKSTAGPGLLAHVLVSKYADHIPLHRQESIFKREGVPLPRSTLGGWVQGSTDLLKRIVDAMWQDAHTAPVVISDATGVLVQAKDACKRAHFYVVVVPGRSVLYRYTIKNDGDTVAKILGGFSGKLHVDASSVYHELFRQKPGLVEVGCWAHARRKFFQSVDKDRERALTGIGFIGLLYDAHNASMVAGVVDGARRRTLAEPILDKFRAWVDRERAAVGESGGIATALGYVERQWSGLTQFLSDGTLRMDTNPAELQLRRQVVGRKNWLFVGSDDGAGWNTVAVSLIASCQLHGIEPWAYLRDVLLLMPVWNQLRVLDLAPHCWQATREEPETQRLLASQRLLGRDGDGHGEEDAAEGPSPS